MAWCAASFSRNGEAGVNASTIITNASCWSGVESGVSSSERLATFFVLTCARNSDITTCCRASVERERLFCPARRQPLP